MASGVHLLTYADRLGGDFTRLTELMRGPLAAFSGVHVLPFFVPYDGDDAGFDPVDHSTVDPRLGDWSDVATLSETATVTADLVVNHASADSEQFQDWLAHGDRSPYAGLFLTFDQVFPGGGTEAEITSIYRPRAGLPFRPVQLADGSRRLVWTSFMPSQIDLDVSHPAARQYLTQILTAFAASGVSIVRLDAVGYAVKTRGTDSFLTPETLAFVDELTEQVRGLGMEVLIELHGHYSQQQLIAPHVDWVYDFALPPLLLHALATADTSRLIEWFGIRPENAVTVLDTHDGIGVIDVSPLGALPGLLSEVEAAEVFARASAATGGLTDRTNTAVAWARLPHQINSTFYDVLSRNDAHYLTARAFQLFSPGLPQVYYTGLLAGSNDLALFERTGVGREVNRHVYTDDEVREQLSRPVVRAGLALVALRARHPAFGGSFSLSDLDDGALRLCWTAGDSRAELVADFRSGSFSLLWTEGAVVVRVGGVEELAEHAPGYDGRRRPVRR